MATKDPYLTMLDTLTQKKDAEISVHEAVRSMIFLARELRQKADTLEECLSKVIDHL